MQVRATSIFAHDPFPKNGQINQPSTINHVYATHICFVKRPDYMRISLLGVGKRLVKDGFGHYMLERSKNNLCQHIPSF
jgi:hypothetical protein